MLKKYCLFSVLFLISRVHSMENNESHNAKVAQSYQLIQKKAQTIYYGGEVCMDTLRKHIISGSNEYSGNLLIWNLKTGTPLPCVGHNGTITALKHNSTKADDNWFVSTDDQKRVCVWDYNSNCLKNLDNYGGNALGIWQLKTNGPYIN